MATGPESDLNQIIVNAVQARIESQVAAALAGDEMIGKFVTAALTKVIEVRDGGSYSTRKTTYLAHMLESVIQKATEAAVKQMVIEEQAAIEEAVRAELRRSTDALAKQLVGSVTEAAKEAYGVSVKLKFPGRD